jgi:hypothetical protein
MNKYYLYRYVRLDKNEPFYIGIGTKTNADINYGTYSRANVSKKSNVIWKKIKEKSKYQVEILLESDDYDFIKQKEVEFIKLYGRIDLGTGCLANMTDGGEGTKNIIVSEKARKLRSSFHKGRKKSKEQIAKQVASRKTNGIKYSADSRRKISLSKSKAVLQYSLEGNLIKKWDTVIQASEELNISRSSIAQCANYSGRKFFTTFNYIWVYLEDFNSNKLDKFNIALSKVKEGKIRTFIDANKKLEIIEDYKKIYSNFAKKEGRLRYLSSKYNLNYSTIRAIIFNIK